MGCTLVVMTCFFFLIITIQANSKRHDILHLLPSIPLPTPATAPQPQSPASSSSSWDDLPSDLEDRFYLSGSEEVEAYEREKKRVWMEGLREARLREREEEEEEEERKRKGVQEGKLVMGDDEIVRPTPYLTHIRS